MENQKVVYLKKRQITLIGTLVNFILMIVTYLVAKLSGSSALFADAMHTASDYFTDLGVLVGIKISSRFGRDYLKIEKPMSLGIGLIIFIIGIATIYDSSKTLYAIIFEKASPFTQSYYWAMVPAFFTVFIKEWIYRYTMFYAKKLNSPLLEANAYHHRTDSYTSIGVLIGVIFTLISEELSFMDPIFGIIVGLFVIQLGFKIFQSKDNLSHNHSHSHH